MNPDEIDPDAESSGGQVMDALKYAWGVGRVTPDDLAKRFDLTSDDAVSVVDFIASLTSAENYELTRRLYDVYDTKRRNASVTEPSKPPTLIMSAERRKTGGPPKAHRRHPSSRTVRN